MAIQPAVAVLWGKQLASIWHIAQRDQLRTSARELHVFCDGPMRHTVAATDSALWVVTQWAPAARVAFRVAFSPGSLTVTGITSNPDGTSIEVEMTTTIGHQSARIRLDPDDGTISATATLCPHEELTVTGWPRDIIADLDNTDGMVHTCQRGLRTGLVHACVTVPAPTAFMYLQDLTVIGEFCQATHASGKDTVGGEWPELGFALPTGERPLAPGEPVIVSSWHVAFSDHACQEPASVAEQYLTLLARLYMHIVRPTTSYVDWRTRAEQTRADLDRCEHCWTTVDGTRYLRAYVGDDCHPPESMVQLAVLLPLLERSRWCEEHDPFTDELAVLPATFADDRIGSIARWLPRAEQMLQGTEEHEHPRVMDSWYQFHPLLNLGRLAQEYGDERARTQFLESLDYVIDVAHHFGYRWPVLYDMDTLAVVRAEAAPGKDGELDVPGLYAHVMLQAFELTEEQCYFDEAHAAIRSLRGRGFDLTYQTNNVAFGMLAALKLFRQTGDQELLDVAHVLAACLFDNVGLWSTRYGHARDRASFFGVFPMPTAPYTAAYEQAEVAAVCLEYVLVAANELPPPLSVLLPELIRHVTSRLDAFYPPCIPKEALVDNCKTGHLLPDLWIPVEDLGDGWDQAGTIGQEVYGAGIAFSTVTRSYVRVPGTTALVYCEYPYRVLHADRRQVTIHLMGDQRLTCRLRVLSADAHGSDAGPCPGDEEHVRGSVTQVMEPVARAIGWRDYAVHAGQAVTISWHHATSEEVPEREPASA